jgi:hypothetical protein
MVDALRQGCVMDSDSDLIGHISGELNEIKHALYGIRAIMREQAADALLMLQQRDPKHIVQAATHQYSQNFEDAITSPMNDSDIVSLSKR